ncbi:MAG: hypothetical protein HY983_01220 [Candidatus Magasanikbacteria bacterium]|nr:hypothetical protein [Candidatus Magasanikbacteria bacterium]
MSRFIWKLLAVAFIGVYLASLLPASRVAAAPHLANYYLGVLPTDAGSLAKLAKTDVLIVSPDQFISDETIVSNLKAANPNMIILAYVPSQSYNVLYWQNDLVFRNLNSIQENWWLRDSAGNRISAWPGLLNTNMDHGWSEYLVNFINQYIAPLPNVDGIFFDMVGDSISGTNNGDIDLNGDHVRDDPGTMNAAWLERTKYLLEYARTHISLRFLVMNGSSNEALQGAVNGRMYETFPTPWEANGSWSALMTKMEKNKLLNKQPELYIFNANTHNTGNREDYRNMRFGLTSSLLTDNVYFGFDYGDTSHHQVWWYDEYDANLGTPVAPAQSQSNQARFQTDVWRRDYTNGLAIVNATGQDRDVDLGGEYEKIIGTQDTAVNNGAIVERVRLPARDGLVMFKTFQTLKDTFFTNGSFARFFKADGTRARNGFFTFEDGLPGGAKIYIGDLNGDGIREKIIASGPHLQIFNAQGQLWFDDYPYGGDYQGELNIAVGRLAGDSEMNIVVAPSSGGSLFLYDFHGGLIKEDVYPLGRKYRGGFSVAIGNVDGGDTSEVVVGTGRGRASEVLVYDSGLNKIKKRFYPFDLRPLSGVSVAVGDFKVNGTEQIAVTGAVGTKSVVRLFTGAGRRLNEFAVRGFFGNQAVALGASDGAGRKEIVVITKN